MDIPAEGADDVGVAMVSGTLVVEKVGQSQSPQPTTAPLYSGFRLMGLPVKGVSRVIGPLCQKQKRVRITMM